MKFFKKDLTNRGKWGIIYTDAYDTVTVKIAEKCPPTICYFSGGQISCFQIWDLMVFAVVPRLIKHFVLDPVVQRICYKTGNNR